MKFYTYTQNNSHGLIFGAHYVIIEANSADEANEFAVSNTQISFDSGCSCCGNRWERASWEDGYDKPEVYGIIFEGTKSDVIKNNLESFANTFTSFGYDTDIYFADGFKEEYRFSEDDYKKAKAKHLKTKHKLFGFSFHDSWSNPSPILKYTQTDYNNTQYFDSSGNRGIKVTNGKKSSLEYDEIAHIYSENKEDIEPQREKLIEILNEIDEFAKTVIEKHKDSIDSNLYKVLTNKYRL